ncbi:unnamed protein product [Thlaspi arvense]|uniref:Amino acid transporter transmembrane domain-containing protein n=1 Tax=Thlaspi arvense TaxID=13288 RepID=A0AAU9SBN3_THLAR|nr:unnamed protein product [Thlaspi arvense]
MCNSEIPTASNSDANLNANSSTDADNPRSGTDQPVDLNSWLPVTASRKAKWWYSAFHNVTAMVGAGVLGLPFAMSQLGWYSELGQHAFGEKLGYWIVIPQQLMVQVASNIVYMVTGGKSLKKCFELLFVKLHPTRQTYFILFFGSTEFILSQTPNFNSLKGVSLLAAIMSFGYSMVACAASISRGVNHHHLVRHGIRSHTTAGIMFDVFNSLGTIAFAFAGHSVALEIQATIPSSPEKPSKMSMWKGVKVAYMIVAFCYFTVAISGFWAFGDEVDDDVLLSLETPPWLIAAANAMVFIHVLGSYQVFAMPVFDMIESYLVRKLNFAPGRPLRVVARSAYVGTLNGYLILLEIYLSTT